VLAEPFKAVEDLPRKDRSAVDGYALIAKDTAGASQFRPKILQITSCERINNKQAKQVWTGTPISKGADSVVMLENTKRVGDTVEVWASLTPNENVSKMGEDVKKGNIAVEAGTRLKPQHLGLMAALGTTNVRVFERPKIAILTTGNELVEVGCQRKENETFDVNRHVMATLCHELGAEPLDLGIAKDDSKEIAEKLRAGLAADAIITTGGTSVGASDLVPEIVNKIGKPGVLIHGIAMRPAMPTALAFIQQKPILIFPGNPVAAMIAFEVFARPLICKILGLKSEEPRPMIAARMIRKTTTALGRKTYVRVHVFHHDGKYSAEPISARGSGIISTMTKANGYVVVPENREGLSEGEIVTVALFNNVEWRDTNV
jgi:molybdenum cofactor synthesis domain-containing protein